MQKQEESLINIMYRFESWTIKKAEHPRIDAFKLWCWRRHLRVPWTARRSNQSILKEINSEYSLEGLMLKLKLQYFGHLMRRANSLEKTDAGKDWGQEKRATEDEMIGWPWPHWFNGHELWKTPGDGEGQGGLACCSPWGHKESDTTWRLNNNIDTLPSLLLGQHLAKLSTRPQSRDRHWVQSTNLIHVSPF